MSDVAMMAEGTMQPEKTKRAGISIEWRGLLLPLSLVAMIVLWGVFDVPLWALSICCLWIPVYYVAYPRVLRVKWLAFEKEFALRFQKGDYKGLLEFYKQQRFLRRFGPRAEMLGKLGLIYSALERYREAELAFERAIDHTPTKQRDRLYFNLANVKFELGRYDAAEAIYRALQPGSPYRHASQTQLALIDMHRGKRIDVARRVLESERERASGQLKARIDQALQTVARDQHGA